MEKLTVIGVRFLALFVLLRAIMSLEIIPSILLDEFSSFPDYWHYLLVIAAYLLISAILFFGSEKISGFIMPDSEGQEFKIDDYQKLAAVLFSMVGLLVIYWSVQQLFQSIASIVNMSVMYPNNPDMSEYRTLTIIFGGLIQLIIGILLFIGGKKLASWWYAFRNWT